MARSPRPAPSTAPGARSRAQRTTGDTRESPRDDTHADAGRAWLAGLAAGDLARMLSLGVDVCMLVDATGVVRACHGDDDDPLVRALADGCGHPLLDLVERASRSTVRRLLAAARTGRRSLRHRIQHRVTSGNVVAMSYRSLGVGTAGDVAMLGHRVDEQAAAMTPQRPAPRTGSADRAYAELFGASTAPIVLLDTGTARVLDANAAARRWFGRGDSIVGAAYSPLFAPRHRAAVGAWVALRDAPTLRLEDTRGTTEMRTFARGGDGSTLRVVELRRLDAQVAPAMPSDDVTGPLAYSEDAVVMCDDQGLLRWANPAFLERYARAPLAAARLRPLASLVPALGATMAALIGRRVPPLRNVALEDGRQAELNALRMNDGDGATIALVLRAREPGDPGPFASAASLAALIGTTPLKSMVRDSAEQVERLCIESTLKLTGNNRSLAARVLGMSRQGLYLKLRQYGLLVEGEGGIAPQDRDDDIE